MPGEGGKKRKPLDGRQRRAAQLIGEGQTRKATAAEVGVSARSVSDWLRRDDFQALVRRARDGVLDEAPTARAVLEAALSATTASGRPDWKSRIAAARALTGLDGGKPPAETSGTSRPLMLNEGALDG